jgi:hypothetical protein
MRGFPGGVVSGSRFVASWRASWRELELQGELRRRLDRLAVVPADAAQRSPSGVAAALTPGRAPAPVPMALGGGGGAGSPEREVLRDRLHRLVGSAPAGVPAAAAAASVDTARAPVVRDVVVIHDEVNAAHGVGALLLTLFGEGRGIATVRSRDHYDGTQRFGEERLRLEHGGASRAGAYANVLRATAGLAPRRILCAPYYADDARTAVALRDLHDAPLCTWIMDDQNVAEGGIPDALMEELLRKSRLRLAISPELRSAYEERYGLRFAYAPPVVPAALVRTSAAPPPPPGRGLVVGNVWGRRWLELLRRTVRGSGVELDWTSPSGYRYEQFDAAALAKDGIHPQGEVAQPEYLARLRACPYVVVPSGTLDAQDDRPGISRFSLPSRIPFVLAVCHAPILVLGSPDTAAARFVERLGVGRSVPYDPARFREAVAELERPDVQVAHRARAAALAPRFSSEGVREWLWRSLEAGAPADDRFERLADPAGKGGAA